MDIGNADEPLRPDLFRNPDRLSVRNGSEDIRLSLTSALVTIANPTSVWTRITVIGRHLDSR